MKNLKKRKSQQLVEFLLVAPFMIIVLGILTEYAYALNVNMTLHTGLKASTSALYREIGPNASGSTWTRTQVKSLVLSDLSDYLLENNTAVTTDNGLNVDYVIIGENAVFMAKYTYLTAFTLPNAYFKILPDRFNFCATVPVPASFLKQNNYDSISSDKLDKIWNASTFSSLSDFNPTKKGAMSSTGSSSSPPASNMIFLLPIIPSDAGITAHKCFFMAKWNGTNLSGSNSSPWLADLTNNNVYKCDEDLTTCSVESANIMNKLGGITSIFFYYGFIGTQTSNTCGANFLDTCWIETMSNKISDSAEDGVLKQLMGLTDSSVKSSDGNYMNVGNYDNIDVSNYNAGVSNGGTYSVDTFGSMVIVHTNIDMNSINTLIGTTTPPNNTYNTNFGTKVN